MKGPRRTSSATSTRPLLAALQAPFPCSPSPRSLAQGILRLHAGPPVDRPAELSDEEHRLLSLLAPAARVTLRPTSHPDELAALRDTLDTLELWPEGYTTLHPIVESLDIELDLDVGAPLQWVMDGLLDAPALAREPLFEPTLTPELAALRRRALPTPLHRWAACLRSRQPALSRLFDTAARLSATETASGGPRTCPAAPPERYELARGVDFELSLVPLPGGRGMVEWYSESALPPDRSLLHPLGQALERAPDLVPGARSWWLGEPPLTMKEPLRVVLTGPSETIDVDLRMPRSPDSFTERRPKFQARPRLMKRTAPSAPAAPHFDSGIRADERDTRGQSKLLPMPERETGMSISPEDVAPLMRATFTTPAAAFECLASGAVKDLLQREARRRQRRGQIPWGTSPGDVVSELMVRVATRVLDQQGLDAEGRDPVALLVRELRFRAADALESEWTYDGRYTPATALRPDSDTASVSSDAALQKVAHQAHMSVAATAHNRLEASSELSTLVATLQTLPSHHALAWLTREAPALMHFGGTQAPHLFHLTVEMLEGYPSLSRSPGEAHRMLAEWQDRWAAEPSKHKASRHLAFILGSGLSVRAGGCPVDAAEQWYRADTAKHGKQRGEYGLTNDNLRQYKRRAKTALQRALQSPQHGGGQP